MTNRRNLGQLVMLFVLLQCVNVHAYIDPGTGSYVLQAILAVVLGGMFFIKMFFKQIAEFFKKVFSKKD